MIDTSKEFVEEQFDLAFDIFEKKVYPESDSDGLMCKVHNAFGSNKSKSHNCLGCNLDESTHHIYMFLSEPSGHKDLQLAFTTYIILLYLIVERIETIFEIIGLPETYRIKHFHIFLKTKKWANFIKHPKAFVLCHHPYYVLENDSTWIKKAQKSKIIIDNGFVFKYYSGDDNKKDLFKQLTNKDNVVVEIPNLELFTEEFTDGLIKFVQLIENNEVYREIIRDKSTIENYFTEDTDNNEK
jgi:hypothetical protein